MPIKVGQAGVHVCMPDYIDLTAGTSNNQVVDLNTGITFDAYCDQATHFSNFKILVLTFASCLYFSAF